MQRPRRFCFLLALFLAAPLLGCGKATTVAPSSKKDKLEEVADMLKNVKDQNMKPPASAADLGTVDPFMPQAGADLRSGEIVYTWGAGLTGGSGVIAWEKKVPSEGGWVLLQDGTVKSMTADEFKSAPKGK